MPLRMLTLLLALLTSSLPVSLQAATLTLNFDGATPEALDFIVVATSGATTTKRVALGAKKVRLTIGGNESQIFVRRSDGSVSLVAAKKCRSNGTGCTSRTLLPFLRKGTFRVSGIKRISSPSTQAVSTGRVLSAVVTKAKQYRTSVQRQRSTSGSALRQAVQSNGQRTSGATATLIQSALAPLTLDADGDGLSDPVDVDNDGDGIIDNYDSNASDTSTAALQSSFSVFSNFKTAIDQSVNLHSTGLTTEGIDALLSTVQTLAIAVEGTEADTAELDCGSLGYCSSGGTGRELQSLDPFPGTGGGARDTDSDGRGELTRTGPAGDFQLLTGATSSSISAGDTLLQYVTDSSGTVATSVGRLNFIFVSQPAIKTIAINSESAQTIDYTAAPVLGAVQNCISAPATGDIAITITGWRPQRPGNSNAGEDAYVDLGNSLITIDLPNAPCVSSNGCSGTGPGNCVANAYSVASDQYLSTNNNGIQDSRGDIAADSSNTYTFTVNLSTCLTNASTGPIAWNADETLSVDLQFRSAYGDNSAQKICIRRAAS